MQEIHAVVCLILAWVIDCLHHAISLQDHIYCITYVLSWFSDVNTYAHKFASFMA